MRGLNEFQSISTLSSIIYLAIILVLISIEDVVFDRIVEQGRFLHNKAHCPSQLLQIVLLDVNAIYQNLSKVDIIESQNQID